MSLQYINCFHHYFHDHVMSIDHMMSSYPHTSGGNMLTLKSVHLALHGFHYIHTSYSYHISLTFDLHNCISTKIGPKHYHLLCFTLTLSHKRVKNPKEGSKILKKRKVHKTIGKYHGSPPWVKKTLRPCYKYIVKGSPKIPFSSFSFVGML